MSKAANLRRRYEEVFGGQARVFRAPGRVNLIGEHTDYNDGFVMPIAIQFSTWVVAGQRDDRKFAVISENYSERCEFDLDELPELPQTHWIGYIAGVARALEKSGRRLHGANLIIDGEVPIGVGLSSSAAIEVATALGLLGVAELEIDRPELAQLCQRAETEGSGTRCGVMDQFISCCGRAGHALMLDCRSLEFSQIPIPKGVNLVICNTGVRHELADGEYNRRRADCEVGVEHLKNFLPGVAALRDVTLEDLERYGRHLPDVIYRRCRHVISENLRVEQAAAALEDGDLTAFGRLMGESHRSLRDDYEVSCPELDVMVELAGRVAGVYGARMTGGGFGGCTINLVKEESVNQFERVVSTGYLKATGRTPTIYVISTANGAEEV